jgi:HEAT repeat protein
MSILNFIFKTDLERIKKNNNEKALVKILVHHRNKDLRRNAAIYIGDYNNDRTVHALIKALSDNDSIVRLNACNSLGKIKNDLAIKPLIKCFSDINDKVRESAKKAVINFGVNASFDLKEGLGAIDSNTNVISAEILGQLGDKYWIIDLKRLFEKHDFDHLGNTAINSIIKLDVHAAAEIILNSFSYAYGGRNNALREKILTELGKEIKMQLMNALTHRNHLTREAAIRILSRLDLLEDCCEVLNSALNHTNQNIAYDAAIFLGKYQFRKSLNYLHNTLLKGHPFTKEAAVLALGEIKDKNSIPLLCNELLNLKNHLNTRMNICLTLSKFKTETIIPYFNKLLYDDEISLREQAALILNNRKRIPIEERDKIIFFAIIDDANKKDKSHSINLASQEIFYQLYYRRNMSPELQSFIVDAIKLPISNRELALEKIFKHGPDSLIASDFLLNTLERSATNLQYIFLRNVREKNLECFDGIDEKTKFSTHNVISEYFIFCDIIKFFHVNNAPKYTVEQMIEILSRLNTLFEPFFFQQVGKYKINSSLTRSLSYDSVSTPWMEGVLNWGNSVLLSE